MSLILKGIDMPSEKEGWQMDLRIHGFDDGTMMVEKLTRNGRPPFKMFRAIQIPKDHGRIIDEREAIRGWCKGCAFNDGTCGKDETICEDKEMCKYAPTILEAEE